MSDLRYFTLYKPYGILSQFSPEGEKKGLAGIYPFPKDVYPIGRLDADSEGLLILSNDKNLNYHLLEPRFKHWRTYWVQVDGAITQEACQQLEKGVSIKVNKTNYTTLPARARLMEAPEDLPERDPAVRYRKEIPTSWVAINLLEGKNRQVRRMTAAVGFPTLRLIRTQIEDLHLKGMQPGDVLEFDKETMYKLLKMKEVPQDRKGTDPRPSFKKKS